MITRFDLLSTTRPIDIRDTRPSRSCPERSQSFPDRLSLRRTHCCPRIRMKSFTRSSEMWADSGSPHATAAAFSPTANTFYRGFLIAVPAFLLAVEFLSGRYGSC